MNEINKDQYYVIFDTETDNKYPNAFTQTLSCAAILTDSNFNVIEKFEEISKLRANQCVAPTALLVNHLSPKQLGIESNYNSNYEFAKIVVGKFKSYIEKYKNICFIAYNSGFDIGIFRSSICWNNLLCEDMYITSMLPTTTIDGLAYSHALGAFSDNLKVPYSEDTGRKSFRLEGLATENNIEVKGTAHEALVDCFLFLDFIEKFDKSDPEILIALHKTSHKQKVFELLKSNNNIWMNAAFYYGKPYYYPLSFIGLNESANSCFFIDLKNFNEDMLTLGFQDLKKVFTRDKNKVLKTLYANKNPILFPEEYCQSKEEALDLKYSTMIKRHNMIQENGEFITRGQNVIDDILSEKQWDNSYEYAETALYAGFLNNDDKKKLAEFHKAENWSDKRKIIKSFQDPRIKEIGENLIFANDESVLKPDELQRVGSRLARRISDVSKGPKSIYMTIENAQSEIDKLREEAQEAENAERLERVEEINDYLEDIKEKMKKFS